MHIRTLCPDSFASNCYLLVEGKAALVIDPSISVRAIRSALESEGADCVGILITHGHFDHILSLDALRDAYPDATVYIHKDDADHLTDGQKNAFATFFGEARAWQPADHLLIDGEILLLGECRIRILHTPGHTPGSICALADAGLISGDTLFAQGYGRYDLPGGDGPTLFSSLRSLAALPKDTPIYPGHGESSTLGDALRLIGIS